MLESLHGQSLVALSTLPASLKGRTTLRSARRVPSGGWTRRRPTLILTMRLAGGLSEGTGGCYTFVTGQGLPKYSGLRALMNMNLLRF